MRGATARLCPECRHLHVSIHAPHAGRDHVKETSKVSAIGFNPRAPCGARLIAVWGHGAVEGFQSTRPMRGATLSNASSSSLLMFQSTRPMRGATIRCSTRIARGRRFNPRAPCGARHRQHIVVKNVKVSIHAPHAGRDTQYVTFNLSPGCFNPRAPCGARHFALLGDDALEVFQSTRPMRGATWDGFVTWIVPCGFNPRAPCGARPAPSIRSAFCPVFQSTRPMRGATIRMLCFGFHRVFQSTRPMRGATQEQKTMIGKVEFQSTRPMRGAIACDDASPVSIHAPHAGRDPH